MPAPVVASLHVYPVKSCRGIALERATIERRGIRHDRRWMVVDPAGQFLTQRAHPRLSLVDTRLDDAFLTLSAEGRGEVRVPLLPAASARRRVTVWGSDVLAASCGEEVDEWLTRHLGVPAALVFMPDDTERPVDPQYARPGDLVGFADGYPVLLATTASLGDLNSRLSAAVPMNRFRPNVVLAGTEPWAEDTWTSVRLGQVSMRVAKPCGRCVMITVDQDTGERGEEPLQTLVTFRKQGSSVCFAQNCVPDTLGVVAVGDTVEVEA